jgi:molybdopterin-binding protein
VTRRSYEELALNVGAQVQVTFKSSAIHLIDA